jgi:hypothetical protein
VFFESYIVAALNGFLSVWVAEVGMGVYRWLTAGDDRVKARIPAANLAAG